MAEPEVSVRPGIAGGVKTAEGSTSDFELQLHPSRPTDFWSLVVKGSAGKATVQLETAPDGGVTVCIEESAGVKARVTKGGVQVYQTA